jgi:hypothetical protein
MKTEDEFEFKPLTQGLGFHRKVGDLADNLEKSNLVGQQIARSIPQAPPKANFTLPVESTSEEKFFLTSKEELESQRSPTAENGTAYDRIHKLIASLPNLDFDEDDAPSLQMETSTKDRKSTLPTDRRSSARPTFRPALPRVSDEPSQVSPTLAASSVNEVVTNTWSAETRASEITPINKPISGIGLGSGFREKKKVPEPDGTDRFLNRLEVEPADSKAASLPYQAKNSTFELNTSTESSLSTSTEGISETSRETIRVVENVPPQGFAIFVDALVVVGLSCLFAVGLVAATSIDLSLVFNRAVEDLATQLGVAVLVIAAAELYLIVSRSLFGSTLGEWASDMQVGTETQQARTLYPILITWRSIVNLATGFVILPLLSMILKTDIAGRLSGVRLCQIRRS